MLDLVKIGYQIIVIIVRLVCFSVKQVKMQKAKYLLEKIKVCHFYRKILFWKCVNTFTLQSKVHSKNLVSGEMVFRMMSLTSAFTGVVSKMFLSCTRQR